MPTDTDTSTDSDTSTDDAGQTDTSTDADLGEAGKKALDEERKARRAAEKSAKDATAELEKLRKSSMTDAEKAIAEAKAAGRQEALAEANDRLVSAEIRSAAAGKLADPGDAVIHLGDLTRFTNVDGDIDARAITSAIDALVKSKPYLAPAGSRPGPLPGGGAKPSSGFSINDDIRARVRGQ